MSKLSVAEFAAGCDDLEYAILDYYGRDSEEIPAEIAADWATAYDALQRINEWRISKCGEE